MAVTVQVTTLRRLRKAHDLTAAEAAAKAGISEGYWLELEAGQRLGMPGKLQQIADAFELEYYDVVLIVRKSWELAQRRAERNGDGGSNK